MECGGRWFEPSGPDQLTNIEDDGKMTPRECLETVLDEEHSAEVLKHRQRLRKPLTDYAAKLLAKKLALCPDPNAAADMMIEKGWQSIEPSWLQPKSQQPRMSNLDLLEMDLAQRISNGTRSQGSLDFTPVPRLSGGR